jgi:aspartate-semialdehyde dehydrogenase
MGLYPLHQAFGLKKVIASTYQAVSGTGAAAIEELELQTKATLKDQVYPPSVYPHPIAFNLIPHVDSFQEDGYTREEMKMLHEGKKILELEDLKVSCTCVRVPVFRAHSISISAEFEKPVDLEIAKKYISNFEGSELCDSPSENKYPMPLDFAGKVKCGVGRIRKDSALENGIAFWVAGDQLWKGAALNAVQIAESMDQLGTLKI